MDSQAVEEYDDESDDDEEGDAVKEEVKEFEPMFGELKKKIDIENELQEMHSKV